MACEMKPICNFVFGFLLCTLPMDTIDVEIMVRMVKGIHTFKKDHTTETATCCPLSRKIKPFLSLQKKIKAYEEEKRHKNCQLHPYPIQFTKKNTPNKRFRERPNRRSKQRKLDMDVSPHLRQRGQQTCWPNSQPQNLHLLPPSLPWLPTQGYPLQPL